ncbi:MAG: HAMP domain-containing sensor histidine kinase [Candidatus Acidiferrum sp.]
MSTTISNWRAPLPEGFRQQEFVFCILNLIVIVSLLSANFALAQVWGPVTPFLLAALLLGLCGHVVLALWVRYRPQWSPSSPFFTVTTLSIFINMVLTFAASATNRNDSQYYILMSVPVLQAAFRHSLPGTLSVVALADFLNFFWIFQYFRLHGGHVHADEYVEAGTVSFIYTVTGVVVWILVKKLRRKEAFLADSLHQLSSTRVHLLAEERLAVVGRLSASIANEIRGPIASIAHSLSIARQHPLSPSEQAALFDSLQNDSSRLAQLTSEFVSFSQPLSVRRTHINIAQAFRSVAASAKQHAASRNLKLCLTAPSDLPAFVDEPQILLALTHLLNFAIDSSPANHSICMRADSRGDSVQLQIEHSGPLIPAEHLPFLFEPSLETPALNGGLGLAITRHICRAHGGEVSLTQSPNSRTCFTIDLPALPQTQ